jgi:hypothetical protein
MGAAAQDGGGGSPTARSAAAQPSRSEARDGDTAGQAKAAAKPRPLP